MNEIKLIMCIVIGVFLANIASLAGYEYFKANRHQENKSVSKLSIKNQAIKSYSQLEAPKINITINNGSTNQLHCGTMKDGNYNGFLILDGKQERSFENIKEGEYIGCSIKIDEKSTTILNWFYVTAPGIYQLLLEQVECKTCTGRNYTWSTTVVHPDGHKEYIKF